MSEVLLERVEETILRHRLLTGGEKVLVAVSGGADSVCLLYTLWQLREKFSLSLCVGHINHLLRGEEADADARFVEELASSLGLPVEIAKVDVKALARENKLSLEDAGRQARYQALEEMAARMGADCIALGHTADDQVETILLNFLRGGGPEGLAGMPITRESAGGSRIVRPLLEMTKAETEAYCREQGLSPRLDRTNLEPFALRNRLRHQVLPILKAEQPALDKVLLRQAEIFRAEDEFLRALAEAASKTVILSASEESRGGILEEILHSVQNDNERREHSIVLSARKLSDLSIALARRVVRESLRRLREGRQPLGLEQIERVLALAREGDTGKRLHLGENLFAEREYERLILSRISDVRCQISDPTSGISNLKSAISVSLPVPGEMHFAGALLRAKVLPRDKVKDLHADEGGRIAFFDAAKLRILGAGFREPRHDFRRALQKPAPIGELFIVRLPKPGDRFIPLGNSGFMKLQDFFTNLKVPRAERRKIPLVCRGEDIVWVAGFRIDDRYKVSDDTREVVRLEWRKGWI